MKKAFYFIIALCLAATVFSCHKEDPKEPQAKLRTPLLTAKVDGEDIKLQWNTVTNALSFDIEYKQSTLSEFVSLANVTKSPYSVKGLEYGITYDFRIKAIGNNTESEWSKVVSATLERYLDQPSATAIAGMSYIDVSWAPVTQAASYKVEHKVALDAAYVTDYEGPADDLLKEGKYTYRIADLAGGITYDVRVAAVAAGYSDTWSETVTVTTTAEAKNMIHNADEFIAWLAACTGGENPDEDVTAFACDIDMSGKTITSAADFAGTLEGQGYAVKNLKSSVPLFTKLSGNLSNIVLDSSCEFTTTENIFGPIAKEDYRAQYTNVVNKAAVTFTAAGDVTDGLSIGGFTGGSNTSKFTNCVNEGAVTANIAGSHGAAFIAGFAGVTYEHMEFTGCKNAGPVSLKAVCGNPRSALTVMETTTSNAGIGVAGFVGRSFTQTAIEDEATAKESAAYFEQCENLQSAVITLNYSNISAISGDGSNGNVDVAGIVAFGNNYIYKCYNYADVNLSGLSSSAVEKKEFIAHVGGVFGKASSYTCVGSCKMLGNINVVDDCIADNANIKAGVGGILGCGGYNGPSKSGQTDVNYCSFSGNINVSGKGKCIAIGGISGWNGKQWNNSVNKGSKINCTLTGAWSLVGGLVGGVAGGATNYTVKSCSCEADISVTGSAANVGGLLGRWGGAQGYGDIAPFIGRKGDVPCSFHGSVHSDQSKNIGFIVGYIDGSGKQVEFGSKDFPIQVSGTFQNGKLTSPVEITSENIETYWWGDNKANTTMSVQVVNP